MRAIFIAVVIVAVAGSGAWASQPGNAGFDDAGTLFSTPPLWTAFGANPPQLFNAGSPYGVTPFDGSQYAGEAGDFSPSFKAGGLYQTVSVNAGTSGTARVQVSVKNDSHPAQPNWGRIGIDPTGGINPASPNIQWATHAVANHPAWQMIETPSVNPTGVLVTVFLEYRIAVTNPPGNAVHFDAVVLTGTLADPAVPGDPPDVSNVVLASAPLKTPLSYTYTLTDDEDADAGATIEPEYRMGRTLDQSTLPSEMYFLVPALQSLPSAVGGDGTGTGNWRIQGLANSFFRGATDRTGTVLGYSAQGASGHPVTLDIKITDWERTLLAADFEGAGLCIVTPNLQYYYAVGAFEDTASTALMTEANWHVDPTTTGILSAFYNLEGTGTPNNGADAIYFRIERRADNTIGSAYSRNGVGYTSVHSINVAGTPMDLSQSLLFGILVNGEVIINVESVMTPFLPATPGTGGDGTAGLSSTSTGSNHTFVWDAPADLGPLTTGLNVQLRIGANDANGFGASASSAFTELGISTSRVQRWFMSR